MLIDTIHWWFAQIKCFAKIYTSSFAIAPLKIYKFHLISAVQHPLSLIFVYTSSQIARPPPVVANICQSKHNPVKQTTANSGISHIPTYHCPAVVHQPTIRSISSSVTYLCLWHSIMQLPPVELGRTAARQGAASDLRQMGGKDRIM